jgi:hypothetical protein
LRKQERTPLKEVLNVRKIFSVLAGLVTVVLASGAGFRAG